MFMSMAAVQPAQYAAIKVAMIRHVMAFVMLRA